MEPEDPNVAQDASPAEPTPVPAEQLSINLKVISPSLPHPLMLTDLPAVTTVQQLKEKIRQQLPARPADNQQRLIYRGRMVNRAEDKLLDLYGEDTVSSASLMYHVCISGANHETAVAPLLCSAIDAPNHS